MSEQACVSPRCKSYGEHLTEPCRETCRGCAPRPARYGFLCATCCVKLGRDAVAAAKAHADLEADLLATGGGGEGNGSNPFPSLSFDPSVAEARAAIAHTLASWCRLISEEAGFALPESGWRIVPLPVGIQGPPERERVRETGLGYLGAYIKDNCEWLAAHPAVDEACDELASLVHTGIRHQEALRSAIVDIGPCPSCVGQLKAVIRREDSAPSEVYCDGEHPHRWVGERQLADLGRLVGTRDGWLSARDVARRYERPIGTVQRWASTERWRKTEDGQRPVLYHPADVEATVNRLSEVATA